MDDQDPPEIPVIQDPINQDLAYESLAMVQADRIFSDDILQQVNKRLTRLKKIRDRENLFYRDNEQISMNTDLFGSANPSKYGDEYYLYVGSNMINPTNMATQHDSTFSAQKNFPITDFTSL